MGSSNGKHVRVGRQIAEGVYNATKFGPDGNASAGRVVTDEAVKRFGLKAQDGPPLEPCPGENGMFHEVERGRGPAMGNSRQYCEGYMRTFRNKREDEAAG